MEESEVSEVVDLVHSLVLQSRPPPGPLDEALSRAPTRITTKSVPSSPCNSNGIPRSQTVPVRKKVQIKSAPLKPPDIGNSSLFPSVEEAALQDSAVVMSPRRVPLKSTVIPNVNVKAGASGAAGGGLSAFEERFSTDNRDKKLKTLEAKLTGPLGLHGGGADGFSSSNNNVVTPRRASLTEVSVLTPTRKTPRSGKLFAELSAERQQKLTELAQKYSKSIDRNQCRNILDELEFLFQLFNSNNNAIKTMGASSGGQTKEIELPLLCSAAEQAYFVIKIVIDQLDKLFISMPPSILKLIIDNYPHKIPKTVRKHVEDWLESQKKIRSKSVIIVNDAMPIDLAKTVTFKSDTDGRANFLHQTDFHNFCKQRDLFYSIREIWTGNGRDMNSNNGGIITDRSKARMSFPPVQQTGGNATSKYLETFPLKVQALFQINHSPTNLFHLASLFVSHYLLEARALEFGGVPKDDNMKEFFQSNPTKLLQLNSRFSTTSAETLESDQNSNLNFRKQFLLLSSSKFVQHVLDRLVMEITKTETSMESADMANPGQILRNIKDMIHLAKLLGFAHCLPYLSEDRKQAASANIHSIEKESVMREHALFRSYQTPPVDLKYFVVKASKAGRLTATCPWIIEFLLQCDPVALLLPSYQPTLKILIHLYRTILSQQHVCPLSGSNKNFLRFYFGMLFSSKNFPDDVLAQLQWKELPSDRELELLRESSGDDEFLDMMEELGHSLVEFSFEESFNQFKRILSWGKLEVSNAAITGDFRHIRPIPASEKSSTATSTSKKLLPKDKILQMQLEAAFFELYSPSIKRSVDFISERMASNFITVAKTQLFPHMRNLLSQQGIFGVRAAEKARMKLSEEMNRYLTEKCCSTVKVFLEPTVTVGVLGLCQRVAIRKARESGDEWIRNYISAGMFPNISDSSDVSEKTSSTASLAPVPSAPAMPARPSINESDDPPFEILILIHRMLRKLNSQEKVDPALIDKVLTCQTFSKAPWAFSPLIDFGMSLITYQPQSLNLERMKQLVNLWKILWTPNANILNPRNLMLLAQSRNPRDSWTKLGSITQLLHNERIMNAENLEQQCLALLRDDWPDEIHKRMSEFLTIVLEAFHEKAELNSESAQVLDWVAWLCSGQPDQD